MKKITLILVLLLFAPIILVGQSVTVGAAGTYATVGAALAVVQGSAAGPDIITILDAGPFLESAQLLINGDNGAGGGSDLTIEASPGIRPVVVVDTALDGAIAIIRNGNVTVKDLILIPAEGSAATRPQSAILIDDYSIATGFTVTLQNLLICPNNGSNAPAAALYGSSVTGASATFRDEGVYGLSNTTTVVNKIYLYDVVACGLTGDQGSDGIRFLTDGTSGSEVIVGEGCVMSFNNGAGFQPGGDEGGIVVKVQGTGFKPVKIFGNTGAGISTTSTTLAGSGLNEITGCLSAGSTTGAGFQAGDSDQSITFSNITFAGNALEAINATAAFSGTYTASGNCIFAGNGTTLATNVIDVSTTVAGTMSITDSAVVLAGPLQLDTTNFDLDGLDDNTPVSNVTKTNVISADPIFKSIIPTDTDFFKVDNPFYGGKGPLLTNLGGAMGYLGSTVSDWTVY